MQDLSCLHRCTEGIKKAGKSIRKLAAVQSNTVVMARFGTVRSSHQSVTQYCSSLSPTWQSFVFSISAVKHLHFRFNVQGVLFVIFPSEPSHVENNSQMNQL